MRFPVQKLLATGATILALLLGASLGISQPAFAEPPEKDKAQAKAKAPAKPPEAQPQFAPVVEAQKKDVKTCLPMLSELSRLAIPGAHTSVTGWSGEAPNERMFSALSFTKPTTAGASQSVSMIAATPTVKGRCDGADVRIELSKQSCEEIARDLQKQNVPKPEAMDGTLLYPTNGAGQRLVLLPAATTGCVVISTGAYYGR